MQQLPWTAAHEKLLTAYAGDALPDVCSARQYLGAGVRRARRARAARQLRRDVRDVVHATTTSRASSTPIASTARCSASRGTSTRDCCSIARDLLQAGRFRRAADDLGRMDADAGRDQGDGRAERYSVLLPLNEFEPLLVLALQQPAELLRDDGRYGNFRSADFRRALDVLSQTCSCAAGRRA